MFRLAPHAQSPVDVCVPGTRLFPWRGLSPYPCDLSVNMSRKRTLMQFGFTKSQEQCTGDTNTQTEPPSPTPGSSQARENDDLKSNNAGDNSGLTHVYGESERTHSVEPERNNSAA